MEPFEEDIRHCVDALQRGGTILYPTDTVWGLGCDATNPEAVKKIYDLKHRPDSKALIVLLADFRDLLRHVAAPDPTVWDFITVQERPTTIVFDGALGFAQNLVGADGSIAIRFPRDPFCRSLLKRFGKPIVSTSANRSGHPAPRFYPEIDPGIVDGVDYTPNWRRTDETPAQPSRILRWRNGEDPVVIRG